MKESPGVWVSAGPPESECVIYYVVWAEIIIHSVLEQNSSNPHKGVFGRRCFSPYGVVPSFVHLAQAPIRGQPSLWFLCFSIWFLLRAF